MDFRFSEEQELFGKEQADLIVTKAAWLQSRGLPCQREATMAKVIASELANQAADLGIQILGHAGAADRHRRPPDAGNGMPDRRPGHGARPAAGHPGRDALPRLELLLRLPERPGADGPGVRRRGL